MECGLHKVCNVLLVSVLLNGCAEKNETKVPSQSRSSAVASPSSETLRPFHLPTVSCILGLSFSSLLRLFSSSCHFPSLETLSLPISRQPICTPLVYQYCCHHRLSQVWQLKPQKWIILRLCSSAVPHWLTGLTAGQQCACLSGGSRRGSVPLLVGLLADFIFLQLQD